MDYIVKWYSGIACDGCASLGIFLILSLKKCVKVQRHFKILKLKIKILTRVLRDKCMAEQDCKFPSKE